ASASSSGSRADDRCASTKSLTQSAQVLLRPSDPAGTCVPGGRSAVAGFADGSPSAGAGMWSPRTASASPAGDAAAGVAAGNTVAAGRAGGDVAGPQASK